MRRSPARKLAERYGLGRSTAEALLKELAASGKVVEGEFRPGATGREWCDPDVLQIDSTAIAREAPASGRAGRARRARPARHALAGRRPPSSGARRAPRCDRKPAGRAAHRVDPRDGDPAGSGRRVSAVRPRCPDDCRRGRLGWPRAPRRTRWAPRALPDRPRREASAAPCAGRSARSRAPDCRPSGTKRGLVLCGAA